MPSRADGDPSDGEAADGEEPDGEDEEGDGEDEEEGDGDGVEARVDEVSDPGGSGVTTMGPPRSAP
ncbi:hypothetical protein AB0K18_15360 [Nonomuraea sp. NPDC049421]|uniref:hypothetical protein n=1 Tax=Nonomuraea sp. NPDC049421 TaxID=3155275 RepID=UPI003414BDAF